MIKLGLFILLFLNLSTVSSASDAIHRCMNANLAQELPFFYNPPEQPFKHIKNKLISRLYQPFHMIHDEIATPNAPIQVQAKFDYDWLLHKDLEDERILAYLFTSGGSQWEKLKECRTNHDGEITVDFPQGRAAGDYVLRLVVEGDGSYVDGYISVVYPRHEAIVFDIDGTLTVSDAELLGDYLKILTAQPYYFADHLLQAYRDKGYELIFLTARPYWMASASRDWLWNTLSQANWPLKTKGPHDLTVFPRLGTASYKANYLLNLIQQKNLSIVRAYGNATTDIDAYQMAGIPKSQTYIIGPHAGEKDTQAIHDNYMSHYYNVAINTPEAHCIKP